MAIASQPDDPPFSVVFVTAGEMPSAGGLHASQVIEPGAALAAGGREVTWIAVVPLLSWFRDVLTGGSRIASARAAAKRAGLRFESFVVPLSIGGLLTFVFRKTLARWAGERMGPRLDRSKPTVLHCRSYYAAAIAIESRRASQGFRWRVSFDMRSLLPEELPLTLGRPGLACYGFARQWEYDLLNSSDAAFLPIHGGCGRISREGGVRVDYAPIQGFDRASGWSPNFERRWSEKALGYAGSIADWHDPDLLRVMLGLVPGASPRLAMACDPRLSDLTVKQYPLAEMPSFYDGLLALVIPGRRDVDDFFVRMKLRCNFFSTKAAEALSMGVPLIVSSELLELADFVRAHRCGAVYDVVAQQLEYPEMGVADDRMRWAAMTQAAVLAGAQFERNHVLSIYQQRWASLFQ